MNRRKFFKFAGKVLGAVAITPLLPPVKVEQSEPDPEPQEPAFYRWNGLGESWVSDDGTHWQMVEKDENWKPDEAYTSGYIGAGSSGLPVPFAHWDGSDWDWSARENLAHYARLSENKG